MRRCYTVNHTQIIDNSVRKYTGQENYTTNINGLEKKLPIVNVGENLWIASNASYVLGDINFAKKVAKELKDKLRDNDIEGLLTAEAKSIGIGYFLADLIGLEKITIARKSVKSYMRKPLIVKTRSITTKGEQILVLDSLEAEKIKDKKIAVFDDVISTGNTINSLIKLAKMVGAEIAVLATVWLEGPWPWDLFGKEIKSGKLVFLSYLPVFASNETYHRLKKLKDELLKRYL